MLRSLRTIAADSSSLTIALIFAVHSVLSGNWLVRLPEIQQRLALSEAELGLALLGMPLGSMLITPLMRWIAAWWSAGRITLVGTMTACVVAVAIPLAGSMAALTLTFLCVGLVGGAVNIAMNAETASIEAARGVPIMATCHGFYSLGGMIGATTGGLVAAARTPMPLHIAFVALALLALLVARRRTLLKDSARVRSSGPALTLPTGPLLGLAVVAFCVQLGEGAMADWSAVYLSKTLGAGAAVAGLGYAFYSLAMATGRFFGDQITLRFPTRVIVSAGCGLAAIGMGAALLIGHPLAALAGFLCVGLGFSGVVPILYRAGAQTPGTSAETGIASVASAAYVGLFIGPPLIGFTAEAIGLSGAFGIVALLALVNVVVAPWALRNASAPAVADVHAPLAYPSELP